MAIFTAIGSAIFGAGTFLAGATAAGLQIAAGIAVNLIAKNISGKSAEAEPTAGFGIRARLQAGGDLPRTLLLGFCATAGSLVYANTWGAANQVSNAYLTQVICLGDKPANTLQQVWVNGELVTLDGSAHPSYGAPVLEYRKDGVDHLWVKFYDGSQTVADPYLTGTVSSAEHPYQSTRVGIGCPYVVATALVNETLFSGFPTFKFAVNGSRLYDPSKDTTAGGSGSQRWDNPATWGGDGDHFPVVQAYNLLRGVSVGDAWLYGLQGLPAARLPDAHWIAQIEKCRASIAGPSGNEATYRSGGELPVNAPIADAIEALLTTCQGRLAEIGGTYKIHVGEPGASVFSFDDDSIISTAEQSFTPFFGLAETVNSISARYPSPTEGWNQKVAPPLYNADYEAQDGNRRLMADVSLDLVPYAGQVQRLMKSALAEARRARRHTFVLPPDAFVLEPGDVVDWTSERNGYETKLFRVDGIVDLANLDLLVDLTEVDPTDYDWDQELDFTTTVDGPVTRVRPAPQPIVDWAVIPDAVVDDDDNDRRPSMRIFWDGNQPDVRAVAFEVRLASSGAVVFAGEVSDVATGEALLPAVFLPATNYEARGRYVPISQRDTEWSSWLPVTTANILLGADDIDIADVIEDAVETIEDRLQWVGQQVRALLRDFQMLGTTIAQQDLANFNDRKTLFREIISQTEEVTASFTELVEVATGPDSAIGVSLTSLFAALGANTSQVNVRFQTTAAPTGYEASYAVQAAVDDGVFRQAAFGIDVPTIASGDPTRFWIAANQFVVKDPDDINNVHLPFVFEDGVAIIETVRFRYLRSIAEDGGDPIVEIDGETGAFTFGAGTP